MNFAIDSAQPAPAPKPVLETDADQLADVVLTRALLGIEQIKQKNARKAKGQVRVRVDQVFRTQSTAYVHYTIENNSALVYRIKPPQADQLKPDSSAVSLPSLGHSQLDRTALEGLGDTQRLPLPVIHPEAESEYLHPGEATEGVVPIRQDLKSPTIVQLVFDDRVTATFVF